jgi:hypothetical protein
LNHVNEETFNIASMNRTGNRKSFAQAYNDYALKREKGFSASRYPGSYDIRGVQLDFSFAGFLEARV